MATTNRTADSRTLSPELVSLIHHVELNKAGWWERSLDRLILGTIWVAGRSLSPAELRTELAAGFSIHPDPVRLTARVQDLIGSGAIVEQADERLKVSEETLKEFDSRRAESEATERLVKEHFATLLRAACPSLQEDETWKRLSDGFLLPAIRKMGAKTYELVLRSAPSMADDFTGLSDFLGQFLREDREQLQAVIFAFLDPKNPHVRAYILGYLNAVLFLEAGSLDKKTLEALSTLTGVEVNFTVFVDTNFLFSILDLVKTPLSETAQLLLALRDNLPSNVKLDLRVLPPTFDEAKRVLLYHRDHLTGLRLTPNLAHAAISAELDTFDRRYVEYCAEVGSPVRAEDYFAPYLEDLLSVLKYQGLDAWNEDLGQYQNLPEFQADLFDQEAFEKQQFGTRAKDRRRLEHDLVLWHFVRERRPVRVESPLEANFWIATVDNRFLAYDRHKMRVIVGSVPVCLHPTALIQMLQFWIPRSEIYEEAVVGSMRLPFLFDTFDQEAERTTVRILGRLSMLEDSKRLPEPAVTSILMNDALRQKMSTTQDVEQEIALVQSALAGQLELAQKEKQEVDAQIGILHGDLAARSKRIEDLEYKLAEEADARRQAEERQASDAMARAKADARVSDLEKSHRDTVCQQERDRQVDKFKRNWLVSGIGLLIIDAGLTIAISMATGWPWLLILLGLSAVFMVSWVCVVDRFGVRSEVIRTWGVFDVFHRVKNWLFGAAVTVFLALALGVAGNAISDLLKQLYLWPA